MGIGCHLELLIQVHLAVLLAAGYSGKVTSVSEPCFSDPGMTNSNMQVSATACSYVHSSFHAHVHGAIDVQTLLIKQQESLSVQLGLPALQHRLNAGFPCKQTHLLVLMTLRDC
jgi:hypothetical protein